MLTVLLWFVLVPLILALFCVVDETVFQSYVVNSAPTRERRNTSDDSVTVFDELFTSEEKDQGAFVLYLIGIFYMFAALAIICDEFFVPALEVIEERFDVAPNVAGATLMVQWDDYLP